MIIKIFFTLILSTMSMFGLSWSIDSSTTRFSKLDEPDDYTLSIPYEQYEALFDFYSATNGTNWNYFDSNLAWVFDNNSDPCLDNWEGIGCSCIELLTEKNSLRVQSRVSSRDVDILENDLELEFNIEVPRTSTSLNQYFLRQSSSHPAILRAESFYTNYNPEELLDNGVYLEDLEPNYVFQRNYYQNNHDLDFYIPSNLEDKEQSAQNSDLIFKLKQEFNEYKRNLEMSTFEFDGMDPDYIEKKVKYITHNINNYKEKLRNRLFYQQDIQNREKRHVGNRPPHASSLANFKIKRRFKEIYPDATSKYFRLLQEKAEESDGASHNLYESSNLCTITKMNMTFHSISGTVPSSFTQLSSISSLVLSYNYLKGPFPIEFLNLPDLVRLELSNNNLTGSLPAEILDTRIEIFNVPNNAFNGTLPPGILQLNSLLYFDIHFNSIADSINNFNLPESTQLYVLKLGNNLINGTLNFSMKNLTKLIALGLPFNQLSGQPFIANQLHPPPKRNRIPSEFLELPPNLQSFNFEGNFLTGPLPLAAFFQVSSTIMSLRIGRNRFTGPLETRFFDFYFHLSELSMSKNYLTGTVPENFIDNMKNMTILSIDYNNFTGIFPASLLDPIGIRTIDVSHNKLTGNFGIFNFRPLTVKSRFTLISLIISDNLFTGSLNDVVLPSLLTIFSAASCNINGIVPRKFFELNLLTHLDLSKNSLHGTIPKEVGIPNTIDGLYLDYNKLTGTIPVELCNSTMIGLLKLGSNSLTGEIPECIGNLTRLAQIDFSKLYLEGTLPESMSKLSKLQLFNLRNNKLTGEFIQVNKSSQFPVITSVDISANAFTGKLPMTFLQSPLMEAFAASNNCFDPSIPESICEAYSITSLGLDGLHTAKECTSNIFPQILPGLLNGFVMSNNDKYIKEQNKLPECIFNLPNLNFLHLGGNALFGEFSSKLVVNPKLIDLSLAHNELFGEIPIAFQTKKWISLDLSFNYFSGDLDNKFTQLYSNSSLSLKVNRISGPIPGSLHQAANIEILDGNMYSCLLSREDLPSNDPYYNLFSCGSDSVNRTTYIWIGLFFGSMIILAFVVAFLSRELRSDNKEKLITTSRLYLFNKLNKILHWIDCFTNGVEVVCNIPIRVKSISENSTQSISPLEQLFELSNLDGSNHSNTDSVDDLENSVSWKSYRDSEYLFSITHNLSQNERSKSSSSIRGIFAETHTNIITRKLSTLDTWKEFDEEHSNYNSDEESESTMQDIEYSQRNISSILEWGHLFSPSIWKVSLLLDYIRFFALYVTMFIVIVLLPLYAGLSSYYSMYKYSYTWIISAILLTGSISGSIISFIGCYLLFIFFFYIYKSSFYEREPVLPPNAVKDLLSSTPIPTEHFDSSRSSSVSSYSGSVDGISLATLKPSDRTSFTNASPLDDVSSPVLAAPKRRFISTCIYFVTLINFIAVLTADLLYVFVYDHVPPKMLLLTQVAISIFKLLWNELFLWRSFPLLHRTLFRLSSWIQGKSSLFNPPPLPENLNYYNYHPKEITALLINNIINMIVIPFLASALLSNDCFHNAFVASPPISSSNLYSCSLVLNYGPIVTCVRKVSYNEENEFNAGFSYRYQCSSSFVTYYTSVYVTFFILGGFIWPLVQLLLKFYYDNLRHKLRSFMKKKLPLPKFYSNLAFLIYLCLPYSFINPTPNPHRHKIFTKHKFIVKLSTYFVLLLSFAAIYPPLAVIVCCHIWIFTLSEQLVLGFLLNNAFKKGYYWYFYRIRDECEDIWRLWKQCLSIGVPVIIGCLFGLTVFDTIGDMYGWRFAIGPCLLVITIAFFGTCISFYTDYFQTFNKKQSTSNAEETFAPMHSTKNSQNEESKYYFSYSTSSPETVHPTNRIWLLTKIANLIAFVKLKGGRSGSKSVN